EQLGKSPGEEFVIHEAIEWVEQLKMWFILPRKIGDGPYTEEKDSLASANKLIICSENFSQCTGSDYGARETGKGFSDIKFIDITNKLPTSIGLIVATRTFETIDERFKSQISIGRCYKPVQGTIFPKCYETQLYELPDNHKYEGVYVKRIEGFFRRLQLSILSSFY
ncbi:MAG: Soluble calcium-activated nucleotidase 1, partial [Paramarteilia canceri]